MYEREADLSDLAPQSRIDRIEEELYGGPTRLGLRAEHDSLRGALFDFLSEVREEFAALDRWAKRVKRWIYACLVFVVIGLSLTMVGVAFLALQQARLSQRVDRLEQGR